MKSPLNSAASRTPNQNPISVVKAIQPKAPNSGFLCGCQINGFLMYYYYATTSSTALLLLLLLLYHYYYYTTITTTTTLLYSTTTTTTIPTKYYYVYITGHFNVKCICMRKTQTLKCVGVRTMLPSSLHKQTRMPGVRNL